MPLILIDFFRRNTIIGLLQVRFYEIYKKNLRIFDINEKDLKGFTTTEKDRKRGYDKFPPMQFRNWGENITEEVVEE